LRQVARKLALELGEILRDHPHVEAAQDRLLGLAVEQEPERRLQAGFRRVPAGTEPLAHLARSGDAMVRLAVALLDDDIEFEGITVGQARHADNARSPLSQPMSRSVDAVTRLAPSRRAGQSPSSSPGSRGAIEGDLLQVVERSGSPPAPPGRRNAAAAARRPL